MPKSTFFNLNEEKRRKIIKSAIGEFSLKGYEKGNISHIAKAAEVSKGSMYQYFKDKKDLYLYVVEAAYVISLEYVVDVTKEYYKMSVFDYIYLGFKNTWDFLYEERETYLLLQNAYFEGNSELKEEVFNIIMRNTGEFYESITKMIDMNKEKGMIKSSVSTELILMYLTTVSSKFKEKMVFLAKQKGSEICEMSFEDFEPMIKDMISLIKNGIG